MRVTVDSVCRSLDKQERTVRTYGVTVDVVQFGTSGRSNVKQDANLLSRLKGIFHDALTVGTQLGIRLAVRQGLYGSH